MITSKFYVPTLYVLLDILEGIMANNDSQTKKYFTFKSEAEYVSYPQMCGLLTTEMQPLNYGQEMQPTVQYSTVQEMQPTRCTHGLQAISTTPQILHKWCIPSLLKLTYGLVQLMKLHQGSPRTWDIFTL